MSTKSQCSCTPTQPASLWQAPPKHDSTSSARIPAAKSDISKPSLWTPTLDKSTSNHLPVSSGSSRNSEWKGMLSTHPDNWWGQYNLTPPTDRYFSQSADSRREGYIEHWQKNFKGTRDAFERGEYTHGEKDETFRLERVAFYGDVVTGLKEEKEIRDKALHKAGKQE